MPRKKPLYWLASALSSSVGAVFLNFRVYGVENVPLEGPVILAANHGSFLDPPLIGCRLPREIHYLARESLFKPSFLGWLIRSLNSVPVDRDGGGGAGLKKILGVLKSGEGVLLFPEGTRTSDGQLQTARPGLGLAILKSGAPVTPVYIAGSFKAWGRQRKWPRPGQVSVTYGPKVDFDDLRVEAKDAGRDRMKAIYAEASDRVMAAIRALSEGARG